jgi:glycosyltransferase involved in cell wall biosynthesis
MQKKVLFISHNAGRTGAPIMLLNLLKWLKENTNISFEILLRGPGPLQEEFADIAPTFLHSDNKSSGNFIGRACQRIGLKNNSINRHHQTLLNHFRGTGISLIYSNTITNGDILETLSPLNCPAISHIHELEYWIEMTGEKNLQQVLEHSNRFIAASCAVKANLVKKHAVPAEKIEVVHSFIPTNGISADPSGIRQKCGVPEEAFVVLGSGHETWRKGKDLFIQLADLTVKNYPDIQAYFLWVGGWQKEEDRRNILHDVQHLGLTGRVHFTGEVNNPLDYFAAGDIFAMVSREDPFPLVCLEAALLEKPVLCFADAGGMPEFVEDDAGFIVPYLDLETMAQKIASLAYDPENRIRLGKKAAEKVLSLYNVSTGSMRIEKILSNGLKSLAGVESAVPHGKPL